MTQQIESEMTSRAPIVPFGALLYGVLLILPKNILSYLIGVLSRIPWPGPVARTVNWLFVKSFSIDMSEAEKPLEEYRTIEEVFSRSLKSGERPIASEVCFPCDGRMTVSSPIKDGLAIQVKGITYGAQHLVTGHSGYFYRSRLGLSLNLAWQSTIYLAPQNYHRVHSPIAGRLKSITYHPGDLWPVNPPFVALVPALFSKNERLVFEISLTSAEDATVYVVMVGALNVGRIQSKWWPQLTTNSLERQYSETGLSKSFEVPLELAAGDELGAFLLGSTVVVLFDRSALAIIHGDKNYTPMSGEASVPAVMGQPLFS